MRRTNDAPADTLTRLASVMAARGVALPDAAPLLADLLAPPAGSDIAPPVVVPCPVKVMVSELLRRLPDLHLAGDPLPRRLSNFISGPETMPVAFTTA